MLLLRVFSEYSMQPALRLVHDDDSSSVLQSGGSSSQTNEEVEPLDAYSRAVVGAAERLSRLSSISK